MFETDAELRFPARMRLPIFLPAMFAFQIASAYINTWLPSLGLSIAMSQWLSIFTSFVATGLLYRYLWSRKPAGAA